MTGVEFDTASGSSYQLDRAGARIRRVVRSAKSESERVSAEWRAFATCSEVAVGASVSIGWGAGRDEHSAAAEQVGTEGAPDEAVLRYTYTTRVTAIRPLFLAGA